MTSKNESPPPNPDKQPPQDDWGESEFDRFESLLKRIVKVPKAEVDKLRKRNK